MTSESVRIRDLERQLAEAKAELDGEGPHHSNPVKALGLRKCPPFVKCAAYGFGVGAWAAALGELLRWGTDA